MLEFADFDLNSVPNSSNSLKEIVNVTMLNQEVAFRSQVSELHQIFRIPIATMEEFKRKGLDNYYLHQRGMSPYSINLNNQSNSSKKSLDLQLSADEFISQCDHDFSSKGVVTGCLEQSIFSKNISLDKFANGLNYPNLSLISGQYPPCTVDEENKSWKGKKRFTSSSDIIDLEDDNLVYSKHEPHFRHAFTAGASNSFSRQKHKLDSLFERGKQKLESNLLFDNGSSRSIVDASSSCQTQSICNSGIYGHHGSFLPVNLLVENKASLNCKVNNLDLNKVQLEDPSNFSNDHSLMINSSITSSSPVFGKLYPKSNVASSFSPASRRPGQEMHDIQVNDLNIQHVGEKIGKDNNFGEGSGPHISYVDLVSDSGSDYSEGLCSDPKISSVGSSSKITNGLSCEIDLNYSVGVEANLPKDSEQSYESECMTDKNSNSIKTMQSRVGSDDINLEKNKTNHALVIHSGEQGVRSSDSIDSNTKCIFQNKTEEYSGRVHTAAQLLVEMSKMPLKEFEVKDSDRPQRSLDSYEEMVLKAEEMRPDDYCVFSNAFLVDETEKKKICHQLKRGTRMRDFQKDILPNLSSLARHEIREDVNILQGVMRSHEYKRMRGKNKMVDGRGDSCKSERNKRSRVSRR